MKHLLAQAISNLRAMVGIGVISSIDDTGQVQTVNLATGDGVTRADVEVASPFGFSSSAPPNGAICVVLAVGGDPSNLVALPPQNPWARFGGLLAGEAVIYGADGSRVHIRAGGVVEIWGGTSVTINTKGCTINAPNGCTINGNVTVDGNLTASGNIADSHGTLDRLRGHYDGHTHPSGGTTSEPDAE
jgi:phage baseplate assembly protein V